MQTAFRVAAVPRDQVGEPIPARTSALGALDAQHVELANEVAEDDRAVATASAANCLNIALRTPGRAVLQS
jgi:hypothetical protein